MHCHFHLPLCNTEEVVPPEMCAVDESSSDSWQGFPKIAHLMTERLKKQAEQDLDSGPRAAACCPGDLEQLALHLWGSLHDSIKSLQSGEGKRQVHIT